MPTTFEELKERMKSIDEISLLEILSISSEDLVERFEDWIENKQEQLTKEYGNEEDNEE